MNYNRKVADYIERYVYDVTRRLPAEQRDDIEEELRGLIEDMLKSRTGEFQPGKEDIEAVLQELGKPSELAAKYRGTKRCLIGPEFFDLYLLVLKIVLGAVGFGITVAMVVGYIVTPPQNIGEILGNYFGSVFSALANAFAWVTIAFALADRYVNKQTMWKGEKWKPADLPFVPVKQARISRSDPIVGIVFSILLMILINAGPHLLGIYINKAPELFGGYVFSGNHAIIPIFNMTVFQSMLLLMNIMICLGIAKEVVRLVLGRYCLNLAVVVTVVNVVLIILTIYVFGASGIWNTELVPTLRASVDMSWADGVDLEYIWSIIPKIFVGLAVFGHVIDTIVTLFKGFRYTIRES